MSLRGGSKTNPICRPKYGSPEAMLVSLSFESEMVTSLLMAVLSGHIHIDKSYRDKINYRYKAAQLIA